MKLVDVPDSKSGDLRVVWVRVPLPARKSPPSHTQKNPRALARGSTDLFDSWIVLLVPPLEAENPVVPAKTKIIANRDIYFAFNRLIGNVV